MSTYTKKILANGLRIIMVPLSDTQTVTAMILAETGSEYEEKDKNGISHFLEHMCFKGTTKRPSSKIINDELDGLGAASNAFTSNNHTGFYAKAHADKTSEILDIVSDIYLHSLFPEEEVVKEKGVVIEEIHMYEDRPQSKVWDVLGEAIFGDQPTGRTILGTKETVSSLTREDIVKYHQSHYVPEATIVVISGKIDEEKILNQVETLFGHIPRSPKKDRLPVVDVQHAPLVKIHFKESDQVHFVLGFRSFISFHDHEKGYQVGLLAALLGKGMSSRLFYRIREQLGLAYYINASHGPELDYGVFTISAGVSVNNLSKALEAIFDELKKIKNELVLDDEMKKVKDLRKGHLYLGLETSDAWADFYGFQELYFDTHRDDTIDSPEDLVIKRDKVNAEQVRSIAKELFVPERLTIAIVGPIKDEKSVYDTISVL